MNKLQILAAYLPYQLTFLIESEPSSKEPNIDELKSIDTGLQMVNFGWGNAKRFDEIKPILKPLELALERVTDSLGKLRLNDLPYDSVQWLLKNHYDIFGLIEKGEAVQL